MTWQPLLEGSEAQAAHRLVATIASRLGAPEHGTRDPWELALFFGYLFLLSGEADDRQRCEGLLLLARQNPPDSAALFGGLAGLGWVIEHLRARGVISGHQALQRAVDRALMRDLERPPVLIDLVVGLSGVGLYAAESGHRDMLAAVVRNLGLLVMQGEQGLYWLTSEVMTRASQSPRSPDRYVDLGVAHGVAGFLPVLARAVSLDVEAALAGRLLGGALAWLLAQARPGEQPFPFWLTPSSAPIPRRPGWCIGNPGIRAVLGSLQGIPGLTLPDVALPPAVPDSPAAIERVRTSVLCHGSAGMAHLHAVMASSGSPDDAQRALFWYRLTLSRGLLLEDPPMGQLLEGAAGVGLAMLAATSAQPPGWSRLLGLDIRGAF